jgi:hypothetical protein
MPVSSSSEMGRAVGRTGSSGRATLALIWQWCNTAKVVARGPRRLLTNGAQAR